MSAARTIDMVPEGCPLSLWCFFRIEEDREKPAAESDLWRILLLARGEPRSEAASPEAVASRHRLADHPQVRTLIELLDRYRALPEDAEIVSRSKWPAAREDLLCFLEAQFGEGACEDRGRGLGWRRFLPTSAWRWSRTLAAVVVVVVVAFLAIALRSWEGLRRGPKPAPISLHGPSDAETSAVARRTPTPPLKEPPAGPAPPEISGVADLAPGRLTFRWGTASSSEYYRLYVLTPTLDTLTMINGLKETSYGISAREIPGLQAPGHFLFRVDGVNKDRIVASTGFVPFDLR
jgi:hypothetical protein